MKSLLTIPAGWKARIIPDLQNLPSEIELPRNNRLTFNIMAIICIWAAFGLFPMMWALSAMIRQGGSLYLAFVAGFAATAVILFLGWRALRLYVTGDTIRFFKDRVDVTQYGLFREIRWSVPIQDLKGLRERDEQIGGQDKSPVVFSVIELVHAEPGRNVPVCIERKKHGANRIEACAKAFSLPVLSLSNDG